MDDINKINAHFKAQLDAAYEQAPPRSLEMDSDFQKYYFDVIAPIYEQWNIATMYQSNVSRVLENHSTGRIDINSKFVH